MILVSPAEPANLRAPFNTSTLPETYGADFLWFANGKRVGVQRKEIQDLLASVADGRLGRELGMMKALDLSVLLVEGRLRWTTDGMLVSKGYGTQWSKKSWLGMLWSVRQEGIWVDFTDGHQGTLDYLQALQVWSEKEDHRSLYQRGGPASPLWGTPSSYEYRIHLVQSLPGVGYELARRIVDVFGIPFRWAVTKDQLTSVKGIGKVKAEKIWRALEDDD